MAGAGGTIVSGALRAESPDDAGVFTASGAKAVVYEHCIAGVVEKSVLGYSVPTERFAAVVETMRAKGIVFEEYDMPEIGLKTVNGVAETGGMRSAWFRNRDGDLLSLTERRR